MNKSLRGISLIVLTAIFAAIGCRKDHFDFNDLPPTVMSYFTTDTTVYDMGDQVHFTNKSQDADSYTWNFGDGTTSTDKDPVKVFKDPGIYTVLLTAVGQGGTGNYRSTLTIKDTTPVLVNKEMYFIDLGPEAIFKVSLAPGSVPVQVADVSGKGGVGIAYDSVHNKIYFTDFDDDANGKVWRMDMDGSNMQMLASGITDPYSIAIDINGGKIYWADDNGNISRANLDGSSLETSFVHITDGMMRGLAFDSKNNVVYFYEVNDENLYAVKTDGTGLAKIIEGSYGYCIYVDEVNGKIYYDNQNEDAIFQSNLNGSGTVKIADISYRVYGMGIDYSTNKFYWANRSDGIIQRSNLDGSNVEDFITGLDDLRGLFIK